MELIFEYMLAHVGTWVNSRLSPPYIKATLVQNPTLAMMRFPITDLLDQDECYRYLLHRLHPDGLNCPNGHTLPDDQAPHDRKRAPLVKYRCRQCGSVFNLFTGTLWSGTQYDCATIVLVLRGFAQGVPTLHLADELDLDYSTLLDRRHRLQQQALDQHRAALPDSEVEADEMFQNVGEKKYAAP